MLRWLCLITQQVPDPARCVSSLLTSFFIISISFSPPTLLLHPLLLSFLMFLKDVIVIVNNNFDCLEKLGQKSESPSQLSPFSISTQSSLSIVACPPPILFLQLTIYSCCDFQFVTIYFILRFQCSWVTLIQYSQRWVFLFL